MGELEAMLPPLPLETIRTRFRQRSKRVPKEWAVWMLMGQLRSKTTMAMPLRIECRDLVLKEFNFEILAVDQKVIFSCGIEFDDVCIQLRRKIVHARVRVLDIARFPLSMD